MMSISDLKKTLATYGDVFDRSDTQLFQKTFDTITTDTISVDGCLLTLIS